MNEYYFTFKTNIEMGNESFLSQFISRLLFEHEKLSPDRYGFGEPVRSVIDTDNIDGLVSKWLDTGIGMMFRRTKAPKYLMSVKWRSEKGLDKRQFPWGCSVWAKQQMSEQLCMTFFELLINVFNPVFGSISTDKDTDDKHYLVYNNGKYNIEQTIGMDVTDQLPGLYWCTYFGKHCSDLFDKLLSIPSDIATVSQVGDGYLLKILYPIDCIGNESAKATERKILEHLGTERFFNIDDVKSEIAKNPENKVLD